jgi:subtilisin family serine protease
MKKIILILTALLITSIGASAQVFRLPQYISEKDCEAGTIMLKVSSSLRNSCRVNGIENAQLAKALNTIGATEVSRKYPKHLQPSSERNGNGEPLIDLSLIYQVKFNSSYPIEKAINLLLATGMVDYAEPRYVPQLLYQPNDPDTASQYYLSLIRAYQAWDVSKGDSIHVVGVTDTGTDLDHPDLAAGIKYNYADPINGVDDDNDGYVDNFMGWDVGSNDNDPSVDVVHGSFVCGLAGAVTDNGVGLAGPGFKTRYLPIKISNNGVLNAAYEGIVYGADMGCAVINCSWGSFASSQYGQDIVDYATFNKGALVVAAAGNANNDALFYPASYKNVLSVTGTNATDTKWSNSSFGTGIDLCAPGEAVYSTIFDNNYSFSSGTSFASPIVAAAAALIKTQFPTFTPGQLGEQLRATADDIYQVSGNSNFQYKLGKGRLNMLRALTESPKSVRLQDLSITDNNDNAFTGNDTLDFIIELKNHLAPLSNLNVTLVSNNPGVTVINNVASIGSMQTLSTASNSGNPFKAVIDPSVPFNTKVTFRLDFTDGTYQDWQTFDLVVNVDYINVLVNDIGTTITSKSRIGYNAAQSQGVGFTYNDGNSFLYEAGLMLTTDTSKVCDQIFGSPTSQISNDFVSIMNVRKVIPSIESDFDLESVFSDDGATNNKIDVEVRQNTYAWSDPADAKYVIVEYVIKNTNPNPIQNLYTGIYADWDIGNIGDNRADFDNVNTMGYCFNTGTPTIYAGIKSLSSGAVNMYAIENNGANGSVNIYDGFTKVEKHTTLTTSRPQAGQTGSGSDVSMTLSNGPKTIAPGDSVKIAFALIAGENLATIQAASNAAQIRYNTLNSVPPVIADPVWGLQYVSPNPVKQDLVIGFGLPLPGGVSIEILDALGKVISMPLSSYFLSGDHQYLLDVSGLSHGVYHLRMNGYAKTIKFVKVD